MPPKKVSTVIYCQRCQQRPATHKLSDSQGHLHPLCEVCATQAQIFGHLHKSLLPALMRPGLPALQACPSCHLSWSQLNQCSHLGCPDCYRHFRLALDATLARLHGHTQHAGRRPQPATTSEPEDACWLRQQMEQAVAEERFEEAALWRDRLRRLEGTP